MNIYPRDDERAIRVQRLLRDWAASGLLQEDQRLRMLADVQVDYRRTNRYLRATLFIFAYAIVLAIVGLLGLMFDAREAGLAAIGLVSSIACFFAAQTAIERYRFYRFGIEEALAVAGVSLFAFGCAMFMRISMSGFQMFLGAAGAAFIVFRRFGFAYAGMAAVIFAGVVPFNLEVYQGDTARRLFSIVIFLVIFGIARERRTDHDWEFPGDLYGKLETTAWVAIYLTTNLRITEWYSVPDGVPQFYWATYAGIWILPVIGLFLAVRDRHRWMLDANIAMAIATMMSNKLYLGQPSRPWDPILFGVMLIVVALGVRRWLASGADSSRSGWIAERILASEEERLALAGSASVLAPGGPEPHTHERPPTFGGGESGGAGASGKF